MKNILSLNYKEAKEFLLKYESHINVDLAPYIRFDKLLSKLSDQLIGKTYHEVISNDEVLLFELHYS